MPSSEFKFYLLIPLLLLVAWVWPRFGRSWFFFPAEGMLARLTRRPWKSVAVVGLISLFASVPPGLVRMPAPKVHDEFCYLLTADTFVHGRLTNPTPPLWEHFESINTIQQPTYAAKYPPGQGALLALGQLLGHPILGVWLGLALGSATVCWMLQAWLPPRWALGGGLLAALHPQVLTWGYNYWGGAVAMTGGALVCGGLRRLLQSPRTGAWTCGAGLFLLAISRPYEGLVFSVLVAGGTGWMLLRNHRPQLPGILAAAAVPMLISALVIVLTVGMYNRRVTGHALRMPYIEHRDRYAVVPLFAWQKIRDEPVYRHREIREMYQHEVDLCWGRSGVLRSMWTKLQWQIQGWWWMGLWMVPCAALPWCWRRDPWVRVALVCLGGFLLALLTSQGLFPHYAAPWTGLLVFAIVSALRQLRLWQRSRGAGRALVRWLCVVCVCTVPVVWYRSLVKNAEGWFRERERIVKQLENTPGRHLVIVRYGANHNPNREWVYNGADMAGPKLLWARTMDPASDRELLAHFGDRKAWLVEADTPRPVPVPYLPGTQVQ